MEEKIRREAYNYAIRKFGLTDEHLISKESYIAGANFVLSNLWQEDTDDEGLLPPVGKDVIVLCDEDVLCPYISNRILEGGYGKGGWDLYGVMYFLSCDLPKDKEE